MGQMASTLGSGSGGGMAGSFMPAIMQQMEGKTLRLGGLEVPTTGQASPYGGHNAPLPRWNGKPLGFIEADPNERSGWERVLAGGAKTGGKDDPWLQAIGGIVGTIIGTKYGGPMGGQIGGRAGRDVGTHIGSIF